MKKKNKPSIEADVEVRSSERETPLSCLAAAICLLQSDLVLEI